MHSLSPDYLASLRFDARQLATLRALGEYRGKQRLYVAQSPEVLTDLRQVAVVESTESSNRLEGVVVAAARLKSLVLKNAEPKSRSEQEVAGYRDALGLIHESGDQMPFSEGTVLQLHGILYRYMPQAGGHWKAANNDIIERHPDGSSRIRFHPVAAHLTPMAMTDLVSRYRAALDQHLADPLVLVPLAILDFLCIHPFADGAAAYPATALPFRLRSGSLHQPGAHLRGIKRELLRNSGSQLPGLARGRARQCSLAGLFLGRPAAGLQGVRGASWHHRARAWRQRRPGARGDPQA